MQPTREDPRLLWLGAVWGFHKGGFQVLGFQQAEGGCTYPKGDVGAQQAAGNGSVASSHDNVDFRECHVCQVGSDE